MQKRISKGVPASGQYSSSTHESATAMERPISARMDDIRGSEEHRFEFAALALGNAAQACREASPEAARIHTLDTGYGFHAISISDENGALVHIEEADLAEVQSRLDEAKSKLVHLEGLVSKSEDQTEIKTERRYDIDIDQSIDAARPRSLAHV